MLGEGDVVVYVLIITIAAACLYVDFVQYNCDGYNCTSWHHACNEPDEQRKAILLLNQQSRMITWKKAFIVAFVISIFAMWWLSKGLLPARDFLPLFLVIFIIVQMMLAFHVSHYVEPINRHIEAHMRNPTMNVSIAQQQV